MALHSQTSLPLLHLGGARPSRNQLPLGPRGWRSRWLLLACNAGRAVGVPREVDGRGAPFSGALRDSPSARGPGFPAKAWPRLRPLGGGIPWPPGAAARSDGEAVAAASAKAAAQVEAVARRPDDRNDRGPLPTGGHAATGPTPASLPGASIGRTSRNLQSCCNG
jgi:hypothetical protein